MKVANAKVKKIYGSLCRGVQRKPAPPSKPMALGVLALCPIASAAWALYSMALEAKATLA